MKINYLLTLIVFIIVSCADHSRVEINEDLKTYKNETFGLYFTNHFPNQIETKLGSLLRVTDEDKNDIGLYLVELNASTEIIKEALNNIGNNYIIKYNIEKYSCLLIVNMFETPETKSEYKNVTITDSNLINKDCLKEKYPIPNFIDYQEYTGEDFWDENFDIYVIDAKSGKFSEKYNLKPNPQMPNKWKNGFSRGITVNREKRIIVYWTVIW